ncbi:hypothetical protein ACFGVR_00015 [Mucilaginibacter sp. AW1-3]
MKKLMFLGVCFMLLFAIKSKAQVTWYSDFPGGVTHGYVSVSPPYNNIENDDIHPDIPSGMTLVGTSLAIYATGDLGDRIDIENDSSTGAISFFWDTSVLNSYPGETFYLHYIMECEYFDGTNYYISDEYIDYGP